MDTDSNKLDVKLDLEKIVKMPNVCEKLSEEDLDAIGTLCKAEFEKDLESRHEWEERTAKVLELALQITRNKSFPWPNAANVKFPLLAIAAIQYAARAYPGLIVPNDIVRYQVFGEDIEGKKAKLGKRISQHMTYQLTEEDDSWEADTDKALLVQPIVGCAFKKTYFDALRKRNKSILVLPRDLVISYYSRDLESAPRLSHIIPLFPNDVKERVRKGFFLDLDELAAEREQPAPNKLTETRDRSQGLHPPTNDSLTAIEYVEQCRTLDLDGDGYAEPYAVTFHRQSGRVVRIIARFTTGAIERNAQKEVAYIEPLNYYVKYPFVPSPDGGIYDLGFGHLLFPINETINTAINQLLDAGTLQTMGGGFLGRGAKIKSGNSMFQPGEWKQVDTTGDDLRKSIFPLPVGEPSTVLFQLLNLLIQYAERLSSAVDQMSGVTPDQNTPAETSRNALEQGMAVYSSIFKRTYRALKGEFQKLYKLNQLYLPATPTGPFRITNADYNADPTGIRPAADPKVMSMAQRINNASLIYKMAETDGGVNRYEAGVRLLEAMDTPDIERVYPNPKGPNALPPPPPSADAIQAQAKADQVEVRRLDTEARHKLGAAKLMVMAEESKAKIKKIQAEAAQIEAEIGKPDGSADAFKFKQQDAERKHRLDVIRAELEVSKAKHDGLMGAIATLNNVVQTEHEREQAREQATAAAAASGGQGPAPSGPIGG